MISAGDFKNGITIEMDGGIWLEDKVDDEHYYKPALFNPDKFEIDGRGDILSTTFSSRYY